MRRFIVSNPMNTNALEDSRETGGPQGDDWATISIAVRHDFKERFVAASDKVGLKPSQYGRMILYDGVARTEQTAV